MPARAVPAILMLLMPRLVAAQTDVRVINPVEVHDVRLKEATVASGHAGADRSDVRRMTSLGRLETGRWSGALVSVILEATGTASEGATFGLLLVPDVKAVTDAWQRSDVLLLPIRHEWSLSGMGSGEFRAFEGQRTELRFGGYRAYAYATNASVKASVHVRLLP